MLRNYLVGPTAPQVIIGVGIQESEKKKKQNRFYIGLISVIGLCANIIIRLNSMSRHSHKKQDHELSPCKLS